MSRRTMASIALVVSFLIDAVANREGWADAQGWDATASSIYIIWVICLVMKED
jgi:hypothetical protein